ncbi:hypothetical protein JCM3770_006208 [Rhodotorula araucariae]
MQVDSPPSPPHRAPSHSSSTRPKGILKHAGASSSVACSPPSTSGQPALAPPAGTNAAQQLAWDEANLSLNDLQRDSTMKITEPKTPFVRYNAETDEVMDLDQIPGFSLGSTSFGHGGGSGPTSPVQPQVSRRGSEASEKMVRVERSNSDLAGSARAQAGAGSGMQVEGAADDDSDEEDYDEETIEHRREFAQKRGRHYSNEAAAMKRAAALLEQEDDEDEETLEERVAANTEANAGSAAGDAVSHPGTSAIPPVPRLPNGLKQNLA